MGSFEDRSDQNILLMCEGNLKKLTIRQFSRLRERGLVTYHCVGMYGGKSRIFTDRGLELKKQLKMELKGAEWGAEGVAEGC